MSSQQDEHVTPEIALNRFLDAIKNQAAIDKPFRDRLVQVLGITVVYEGEGELDNVEPHIVASRKDELAFRAIYARLSAAKVRAILTTKAKLASASDVKGKSLDEMVDMLWTRARARAEERGLV